MTQTDVITILKLVWPLILIQLAVQGYALYDLWKKKKVRNLNIPFWILLIFIGNGIGALIYLLIGRSEEA